jgi:hypothetical protein
VTKEGLNMANDKVQTPADAEAVRKYMSSLGKKSAAKNKKKGSAYFKWVRSHRKPKEVSDE